jgi:hypothetical protein
MNNCGSVYSESSWFAFFKVLSSFSLRRSFYRCIFLINHNFFFRQYCAAFLPNKIPVSKVDHPLDEKIPFTPSWIKIYIDFSNFWIRVLSFLLRRYGRRVYKHSEHFIRSVGELYVYAAQVYKKNLSTTKRPFYIACPRFFMIHFLDPHLMCVPSLHVMVAIHTYVMFADIVKQMGEQEKLKEQVLEIKQGALAISRAVLFVKQHSVNCIPAALYAMTCYFPELFPPEEASVFTEEFFSPAPAAGKDFSGSRVHPSAAPEINLSQADITEIKTHILNLYRKFLSEKQTASSWEEPLINFLKEQVKQ